MLGDIAIFALGVTVGVVFDQAITRVWKKLTTPKVKPAPAAEADASKR